MKQGEWSETAGGVASSFHALISQITDWWVS